MSPRLFYVVNARFPSHKAYGIQIAKMCEAFVRAGVDLTLVIPRTAVAQAAPSVREFYDLSVDIKTVKLPVLDCYGSGRRLFIFSSLIFIFFAFFYLAIRRLGGARIYTIDMDSFSYVPFGLLGIPCIAEMHLNKPHSWWRQWFFNKARIIAVNAEVQKQLRGQFHIPENRMVVEPNGVDESWFAPQDKMAARQSLGLASDERIALYVGRFYPWKELGILVDAARIAPHISWYVVGGSADEFKRVIKVETLPPNLHVVGECEQSKVPQWLAAADTLLILGSKKNDTSYKYTAPMKVYEYMAAMRPVVASNTPALQSLMTDEVLWYTPDDAAHLVQKVEESSKDTSAMVAKAGDAARVHTWNKRAERILSLIRN